MASTLFVVALRATAYKFNVNQCRSIIQVDRHAGGKPRKDRNRGQMNRLELSCSDDVGYNEQDRGLGTFGALGGRRWRVDSCSL